MKTPPPFSVWEWVWPQRMQWGLCPPGFRCDEGRREDRTRSEAGRKLCLEDVLVQMSLQAGCFLFLMRLVGTEMQNVYSSFMGPFRL